MNGKKYAKTEIFQLWENFKTEIKFENRFFFSNEFYSFLCNCFKVFVGSFSFKILAATKPSKYGVNFTPKECQIILISNLALKNIGLALELFNLLNISETKLLDTC